MKLTRRKFIKTALSASALSFLTAGYAFGLEPFRLRIQRYHLTLHDWPANVTLTLAALSDLHACNPWMGTRRIASIVEATHALNPDLIVLLGDYTAGHRWVTDGVDAKEWASALRALKAPLGVFAILGNHDWWDDPEAQLKGKGPTLSHRALQNVGISVLENTVVRLVHKSKPFYVAGLGDQIALLAGSRWKRSRNQGVDDLPGTLAQASNDAPIILLAHEPDIFVRVPDRVSLTLSGHTHGGQVRVLGYSPVVPSRFGNRFAYGHIVETNVSEKPRHLIVSGGLGCSILPVRFGVPPEITLVTIKGERS